MTPGASRVNAPMVPEPPADRGRQGLDRARRRGHRRRADRGARPGRASWSRRRSMPADPWSRGTRRCWPGSAGSWPISHRLAASIFSTRPPLASAIPVIRPLRESLAGERIVRVMGIVNGTTNFILSRMAHGGEYLRRGAGRGPATRVGRGRPDGRRRGVRRRRKGRHPGQPGVRRRRHRRRRPPRGDHRRYAFRCPLRGASWAMSIKPLAVAERVGDGSSISVRVHPAVVPSDHPLASVRRCVQRRVHRGRARRRDDAVRTGGGRDRGGQRRARRPHRRRPPPPSAGSRRRPPRAGWRSTSSRSSSCRPPST